LECPPDPGVVEATKWPTNPGANGTDEWPPDPGGVGISKRSPNPGADGTSEWPPYMGAVGIYERAPDPGDYLGSLEVCVLASMFASQSACVPEVCMLFIFIQMGEGGGH
jgi:hypothetical protein